MRNYLLACFCICFAVFLKPNNAAAIELIEDRDPLEAAQQLIGDWILPTKLLADLQRDESSALERINAISRQLDLNPDAYNCDFWEPRPN